MKYQNSDAVPTHGYNPTDEVCVHVTGGVMIFSGAAMNRVADEMRRINAHMPAGEPLVEYWDFFNWCHSDVLCGKEADCVFWVRKGA